jgi:tryptophan synthase alpha chain
VPYLTAGDPSVAATLELAASALAAGADAIELGLPTAAARPSGADIAGSFGTALAAGPVDLWTACERLRAAAPLVPLIGLAYSASIEELGWSTFLARLRDAGVDALVIADAREPKAMDRVGAAGISPIPVIRPDMAPSLAARLETSAGHLSYLALAGTTGGRLDVEQAAGAASAWRARSARPFLAGFGIRTRHDVEALAPHADGIVVGSELLRRIRAAAAGDRHETVLRSVREWKSGCARRHESGHALPDGSRES